MLQRIIHVRRLTGTQLSHLDVPGHPYALIYHDDGVFYHAHASSRAGLPQLRDDWGSRFSDGLYLQTRGCEPHYVTQVGDGEDHPTRVGSWKVEFHDPQEGESPLTWYLVPYAEGDATDVKEAMNVLREAAERHRALGVSACLAFYERHPRPPLLP